MLGLVGRRQGFFPSAIPLSFSGIHAQAFFVRTSWIALSISIAKFAGAVII